MRCWIPLIGNSWFSQNALLDSPDWKFISNYVLYIIIHELPTFTVFLLVTFHRRGPARVAGFTVFLLYFKICERMLLRMNLRFVFCMDSWLWFP